MIVISKTARKRFFAKVDVRGPNECWEWDEESAKQFRIAPPNKMVTPHHAAWLIAGHEPPPKRRLYRVCGNLRCVNVAHMRAAKPDLSKGKGAKPGVKRGSGQNTSLDVKTALEIRIRIASGERLVELADEYGLSKSTLMLIKAGTHWAVDGMPPVKPKPAPLTKVAKLSPEDIRVIDSELALGVSVREIMGWFGVSKTTVYKIARGDHTLQKRGLA